MEYVGVEYYKYWNISIFLRNISNLEIFCLVKALFVAKKSIPVSFYINLFVTKDNVMFNNEYNGYIYIFWMLNINPIQHGGGHKTSLGK